MLVGHNAFRLYSSNEEQNEKEACNDWTKDSRFCGGGFFVRQWVLCTIIHFKRRLDVHPVCARHFQTFDVFCICHFRTFKGDRNLDLFDTITELIKLWFWSWKVAPSRRSWSITALMLSLLIWKAFTTLLFSSFDWSTYSCSVLRTIRLASSKLNCSDGLVTLSDKMPDSSSSTALTFSSRM